MTRPAPAPRSPLSARLRRARRRRGLTQLELAELAGIGSQSVVSMYETGKRTPSIATLRRLARALDVPAGLLLG